MANYPSSAPAFTTLNNGDTIDASQPNQLGDEITAIGSALLAGLAHTLTTNGQVAFPSTANPSAGATTLDDYRELTWTPTIGGSTSQSGQIYSSQVGVGIKIGQLTVASFNITLSTLGTITGSVQIKGLPFAVNPIGSYNPTTAAIYWSGMTASFVTIVGFAAAGTSVITIAGAKAAATGLTDLVQADLSATTALAGLLIYRGIV